MKTRKTFKTIYISHPLRGGMDRANPDITAIVNNKMRVDEICRAIIRAYPDVLPLSPVNAFSFFNAFEDDEAALETDMRLLELADGLWVFGEWETSEGCRMEIARARELAIPISYENGTSETPEDYYCPAMCDCDDLEDPFFLIQAYGADRAKTAFACTERCMTELCSHGPVLWRRR